MVVIYDGGGGMARIRFLALGELGAREGIVAIELDDDWRLVVFYSAKQGMDALREASISAQELAYWEPVITRTQFGHGAARPQVVISGTAASFIGILLTALNGKAVPIQRPKRGTPKSLAIFRVPVPEASVSDDMMGVRGEEETFEIFYSGQQAVDLLAQHRTWLGEEAYQRFMAEVERSPLPASSLKETIKVEGYPAWLINEMVGRYETVRARRDAARPTVN